MRAVRIRNPRFDEGVTMRITITDDGRAEVADADNLRALDVAAGGRTDADIDTALRASGIGRLEGEHAWLDAGGIKEAARGDRDDAWADGFDGMIAYARSKGWANEAGEIRAHLDRD